MSKLLKLTTLSGLLLFLTGCVNRVNNQPSGIVWDLLGRPIEQAIFMFAEFFGKQPGSYGIGIIIVTVIIRIFITPLNLQMMRANTIQQEKMTYIKPEMDAINQKMKQATTPEEQMKLRQEMLQLQQAAGIQLISASGCLPIFIQMPLFSALYFATSNSPEILNDIFLNIPLGQPSMVLMIITSVLYFLQGYISQIGLSPEQKQMGRSMLFVSPLMNVLFAQFAPAGAALYWTVGGVFSCLTSLYTVFIQKPSIKKQVAEEMKNKPIVFPERKDVTETQNIKPVHVAKQRRNEGKQRR